MRPSPSDPLPGGEGEGEVPEALVLLDLDLERASGDETKNWMVHINRSHSIIMCCAGIHLFIACSPSLNLNLTILLAACCAGT